MRKRKLQCCDDDPNGFIADFCNAVFTGDCAMPKNSLSLFSIPMYVKLVFVMLFCLAALCGCGDGGVTTKSPVVPQEKPPDDGDVPGTHPQIPSDLESRIKNDFNAAYDGNAETLADITIDGYFGTYNGSVALSLHFIHGGYTTEIRTDIIAGKEFTWGSREAVQVWRDGSFYRLQQAYEDGLLTQQNIDAIHALYYAKHGFSTLALDEFEEKIITEISVDDDFSDELILVGLSRNATFSFKQYSAEDFPEIGNVDVEEITKDAAEIVRNQFESGDEIEGHLINVAEFRRILKLTLHEKGKENVIDAIRQLEKRDDILCAQPSYHGSIDATYPSEYSSLSTMQKWAIDKIGLPNAWDITTGSSSVIVAVADTGIFAGHPELTNRISSIPSVAYIGANPLSDVHGHGTHVAGTIGAQANNGGMVGVAWDVRLVSLKVFSDTGSGGSSYTANLTSAVTYSATKGIHIINHSGGGYGGSNPVFETALRNYSGLFVCASGNGDSNNDSAPFFPSNTNAANLISVGATAYNADIRATPVDWGYDPNTGAPFGSNYGATTVDLFAPGTSIYSSVPNNVNSTGYASWSGTSMAAPHVAGVAALMKSQASYLDAKSIKKIINKTVDTGSNLIPANSLTTYSKTGGRLNANAALDFTANTWIPRYFMCVYNKQTCITYQPLICQSACEQQLIAIGCIPASCLNLFQACYSSCMAASPCESQFDNCVANCSN